jgi:hypothetical protein
MWWLSDFGFHETNRKMSECYNTKARYATFGSQTKKDNEFCAQVYH